ncbi:MAG: sulfurtransferase [Burkholderiaceae bacterium]|nr:sulfurtransferase [Burkholderiaceae bacterium]
MSNTPAPFRTLISAAELQALRSQELPLLLVDVSFDLTDPGAGERAYQKEHLPGAHYLHLERDLSGPKTSPGPAFTGRHPLPDREAFALELSALGLNAHTQVVVYDNQNGITAARLWWMLRWLGHEAVAVLDGGLAAWCAGQGELTSEPPAASRVGNFKLQASLETTVDAPALLTQLGKVRLIDARAGERFRGETEPLDAKAGHIPGAVNRFFKDNLGADGRFKPAEQLQAEFEKLLAPFEADQVVHQCGSGVTACHNLLAMAHAGFSGARLYPGSWSEWSADPGRPTAQG